MTADLKSAPRPTSTVQPLTMRVRVALLSDNAPDPIVPLMRQWCEAYRRWDAILDVPGSDDESPECSAVLDQMFALEAEISKLTPVSPDGLAALSVIVWNYASGYLPAKGEEMSAEQECLVNLFRVIWSIATGEDGLPQRDRLTR